MKKRTWILPFLIVLFVIVAVACGCHIWKEFYLRNEEQLAFEKLENETVLPEMTVSSDWESCEQVKQTTMAEHDNKTLRDSNEDYIGWISIPDTVISYPVMYTPDDSERYLHLDFDQKYSYSGTPFLDARCDPYTGNLIIYAHNMVNGTMFGSLDRYLKRSYLIDHKMICLELQDGMHTFEIVCVATVECNDPWYYFLRPGDAVQLAEAVANLRARSRLNIGELPMKGERMLTLSTCTGWTRSSRLIVVAKEVLRKSVYKER